MPPCLLCISRCACAACCALCCPCGGQTSPPVLSGPHTIGRAVTTKPLRRCTLRPLRAQACPQWSTSGPPEAERAVARRTQRSAASHFLSHFLPPVAGRMPASRRPCCAARPAGGQPGSGRSCPPWAAASGRAGLPPHPTAAAGPGTIVAITSNSIAISSALSAIIGIPSCGGFACCMIE